MSQTLRFRERTSIPVNIGAYFASLWLVWRLIVPPFGRADTGNPVRGGGVEFNLARVPPAGHQGADILCRSKRCSGQLTAQWSVVSIVITPWTVLPVGLRVRRFVAAPPRLGGREIRRWRFAMSGGVLHFQKEEQDQTAQKGDSRRQGNPRIGLEGIGEAKKWNIEVHRDRTFEEAWEQEEEILKFKSAMLTKTKHRRRRS